MIQVEIPDKNARIEFPDNTDPETMKRVIRENFYKPSMTDRIKQGASDVVDKVSPYLSRNIPPQKLPSRPILPEEEAMRNTIVQTAKDVAGVVTKAGAGMVKGGTLGIFDPEKGTLGIPFTSYKTQVRPPLNEALKDILGVSPEIADNPYIQLPTEYIGLMPAWKGVGTGVANITEKIASKIPAKIIEKTLKLLPTIGKPLERIGETAITAGTVGAIEPHDKDETLLSRALDYAAFSVGLHLAGEIAIPVVNYIKNTIRFKTVTKNISAEDLFNAFTGKESSKPAQDFVKNLSRKDKVNIAKGAMKGKGVEVTEKVPRFSKTEKGEVSYKPEDLRERDITGKREYVEPDIQAGIKSFEGQPVEASPIEIAKKHGKVIGIDADTKLPIIDTKVKPIGSSGAGEPLPLP